MPRFFTYNAARFDDMGVQHPVYVAGGMFRSVVLALQSGLLDTDVLRGAFLRSDEDICGRVGEHFEEVWKRVESGLLLKEVCSRYVFGFFDGVPARRAGGYYLPLDVGHSWKSVKYALQRREAMAVQHGVASCFHVRGILYGESLPTQPRSKGGHSQQAGAGRGRGRARGRAGQNRGGGSAAANVLGSGAGSAQDVGASSHGMPIGGWAPMFAATHANVSHVQQPGVLHAVLPRMPTSSSVHVDPVLVGHEDSGWQSMRGRALHRS